MSALDWMYYQPQPISIPGGAGVSPSSLAGLYGSNTPTSMALAGQLGQLNTGALGSTSSALRNVYGATAGGEGLGSLGFTGFRAGAARAIPGLAVAQLGPKAVDLLPVSRDQKDLLGNVVAGAGLGAAAGAPFEGVGAIPGALIGGGIGLGKGLLEMFGGGDEPSTGDYKTQLASAASQFGLDPGQYTAAFDLLSKAGVDDKTLATQLAQQVLADGQTKKQNDQAIALQRQQHTSDQQFALAMQAQAAKFFTPYVNNIITSGQTQADLLRSQADNLPAPYRDVMLNQAQQALGQSQRLAGAYAAQAALLPSQYMMSQDIKRQQELAQLQYQQAVVNAQTAKSGGTDFSAIAQQLAGQTG